MIYTKAPRLSYIEHFAPVYTPKRVTYAAPICLALAGSVLLAEVICLIYIARLHGLTKRKNKLTIILWPQENEIKIRIIINILIMKILLFLITLQTLA